MSGMHFTHPCMSCVCPVCWIAKLDSMFSGIVHVLSWKLDITLGGIVHIAVSATDSLYSATQSVSH